MNKKIDRTHISIHDNESNNLADSFMVDAGRHKKLLTPGVNKVIIESRDVKTGKLNIEEETTNLIVYRGRHWLMQRAFGFPLGAVGDTDYPWDSSNVATGRDLYKDMYITWFALGGGGADSQSPLQPFSTSEAEYELRDHLKIRHDDNLDLKHLRFNNRDYHAFDINYPQYLPDYDEVAPPPGASEGGDPDYSDMENVIYGDVKSDAYLRALIRVTITPEEYNGGLYYNSGGDGEEYSDINEAGLFVSTSHNPESFSSGDNDIQLFAKVNFSTFRKDETREIVFSWYLYF